MRFKAMLILIFFTVLTGCALEYRKAGGGVSGYDDQKLKGDRFLVYYTETERVPWEKIHQFVLKRCAEITQREGYTGFDVLSKKEQDVYLQSDVKQISVPVKTGEIGAQVSAQTFETGAWLPGRRVVYEIQLLRD